jgi:hypothetical protein
MNMTGGFAFEHADRSLVLAEVGVVYLITILLLNLLVGILSEKLAEVRAEKTISTYKLLLSNCIDFELLKGVFYCSKDPPTSCHLIYAIGDEGNTEQEGQINHIMANID